MGINCVTRRDFLKHTGLIAGSLYLSKLRIKEASTQTTGYPYRGWEDLYRQEWSWDRVARGTHLVNCWLQSACCFNLYVRDGIIIREEQAAEYPQTNPDLPDANPRGCQKGACYSQRMYSPNRIKYPLKRVGKRGEGKWKRLSWDEALDEITDILLEVILKEGSDKIVWDLGTQFSIGSQGVGLTRLALLLGTPLLDMNPEIGDARYGAAVTFGKIVGGNSADDWFHTDILLIWGGNPAYTNIPNCHYFLEARYHGTRLIAISPDYNASAIHTDLWIPINVGTDAALALSLAQVIIQQELYHKAFIREQTDLPLLIRSDTKKFLRESDLKSGGRKDVFYFFDLNSQGIKPAPKTSLQLGDILPALEGSWEIDTLAGKVQVRPVFDLLKQQLVDYTPEKASSITGIDPDLIVKLARDIAQARSVSITTTTNFCKFYHGSLIERAQILLLALCGYIGKKGSGFNPWPMLWADAFDVFPLLRSPGYEGVKEIEKMQESFLKKLKDKGYTEEMGLYELARQAFSSKAWVSAVLFWYIHGGLSEVSGRSKAWDPYLTREVGEYLKESLDKGWHFVGPDQTKEPRIMFESGGNMLRRVRGYPQLLNKLLPKLKLLITIDWRMSSTGLYSDFVLPVAGWYEKIDIKYATPVMPYFHITNKAVEPLYEAKPEYEIFCLLAKKIQEKAKARNISSFIDSSGQERRLDNLYDALTLGGYYKEKEEEKLAADFVQFSHNLPEISWEDLKKKGFARATNIGKSAVTFGNATDIKPHDTITCYTWHTEKKTPYPTLTRRIQFYLDHPFYLELGEALPVHKEPPKIGGDYPLVITGGHTRWSIHAAWRDDRYMLRLQRGTPVMYMNDTDAAQREIADGEEVLVKNDLESFTIQVKTSPAVRPGQVIIYHAWENYQFKGRKLFQNLMPSPLNPRELAGGYFHLRPMFLCLHPGQNDRDTRVEVMKL
jgi:DMSO reductase family type II enzyme molybdopterin subunit